ncbi:hypothetical protein Tco_0534797 [Tanacetum coccineum]
MSGGGVVDLTGDDDPTDEDGDVGMGDLTGVLVSLGDEISSGGKKSQESNIGDSDNTGDGGKTAEDMLGVTTLRDTLSYYPKRYWEMLPKEILGDTIQRDIRRYYPKRYWESLPEDILGDITLRDTSIYLGNNISG